MAHIHKKNLIISYKNLTDTLREKFKMTYPEGYEDFLQKTIKPNGEPMFTVPLETEDTFYLVKFDVKIDSGMVEEDDLEAEDKAEEEGDFAPLSEAIDKEEGRTSMRDLLHGADMEDFLADTTEEESLKKRKKRKEETDEDVEDNEEDDEDYDNGEEEVDEDEEPEMDEEGPSDEDLADIERMERELLGDDITDLTAMPLKNMRKGADESAVPQKQAAKSPQTRTTVSKASVKANKPTAATKEKKNEKEKSAKNK
ncbi:MAG: hypothetical protein SPJ13_02750 [Bacteroidales bacterium]|nr:hypothetical protein [Bacteroidales bacterium]